MGASELTGLSVYLYSLAAISVVTGVSVQMMKSLRKRINLRKFMNLNEMVLFLAAYNFLLAGTGEFSDRDIVTTLQRGLSGFLEGFIRFLKGSLLIPVNSSFDLSIDVVLAFLSSPRFAMALTALILLSPPVVLFLRLLITPEPEHTSTAVKAEKRKRIALYRGELLRRGTPIIVSLAVLIVLLHAANLAINPTYEPPPVPLIAGEESLRIPMVDRLGDVSDGKLRKYSVTRRATTYRILVAMRPDGEVVATLDACEICPPQGYVQRGRYLICKFCKTPMPIESFGKSGGCNPIPLPYELDGDYILVWLDDIEAISKGAGSKFVGRHYR
jgi:uncharacterized membrane protein